MRNASGHQGQIVKMTGSEKKSEQEHVYNISSIKRVTRKFRVVVVQNNGKEMYKKSVLPVQSCCFFFLIWPIAVVFYRSCCLHRFFSITPFKFCLSKLISKRDSFSA